MNLIKERIVRVDDSPYTLKIYANEAYTVLTYSLEKEGKELDRRKIYAGKGERFNVAEWCARIHWAKTHTIQHLTKLDEWDGEVDSSIYLQ